MGILSEFTSNFKVMNKNLKWFMLCIFINGVIMSSTSVLLSIYYKDIGFTESIIGNLLSLRTLGNSLGALSAMVIVDKLGTKKSLFIAYMGMAISGIVFVNLLFMPILQLFSLTFGMSQGILMVIQSPFLRKNSNTENVVTNFSTSFVLSNAAMFIGNFMFGAISDMLATIGNQQTASRQIVMNISFLILLTATFAVSKISLENEEKRSENEKLSLKSYAILLSNKRVVLYLVKVAFMGIGAGLVVPFFSVYIKESLEVSDSVVGIIMSISQIGTVVGGLCIPFLTRRFGSVNTIIACQLMSIPFLFSISVPQGIIIMTISFFFRSSFMNMANPVIESLAMDLVEEKNRTIMSSVFMLTNHLFRAIGTSLGGYIMQNISYNTPYYFTIMFYIINTFLIYTIFGKKNSLNSNLK